MSSGYSSSSKRARNAEEQEYFDKRTRDGFYDLNSGELWWKDRYQVLLDHGYQLRPRHRPGWVPSWKDTDLNPVFCEDSMWNNVSDLVYGFSLRIFNK